ncbi:T9SS type A sorting domain-containing protein [Dyadobacter chenwenxiniae]|uniref:T9SS type A sorting domain-containing protein n=1 Tax=Dyadobacter chenwenxiniae TaxID=2906456 RepID=A0A9X1PJF8_9BACT|nr:T9SS type A sorting domain-containing protein [Dyadobacter chenwenxiniae]MCF0062447.1 T9SS type A sorting domain-containing protein [Dyadobacter chenwenxiniae]UON83805.1 T9SS type A sorting domain-containing protein [Dyadobacter chenwenxiniae]
MNFKFILQRLLSPLSFCKFQCFFLFGITLSANIALSQRIAPVYFNKLPQDLQLYPRNAQNEATVPVSGVVETDGYNYISVQILRNNALHEYLRSEVKYAKGLGSFSTEAKIKAELANYHFKIYLCKGTDSTLITERRNVVAGDVYVVSGQSNSTGFFTEKDTSNFCRTFGKITANLNTAAYDPADTLWAFSNQHPSNNGVGTMGLEIQKQLIQHSNVPNCLINAGFHWSSAAAHAQRTESNPADLNNGYGRMLYRLQKGGLASSVKAYIFRQGESEAYHEGGNWSGNFDVLRKNLKQDLANLAKIYVFQIDVIYYPSPVGAEVRDYQRKLPDIYPDLRSLATVGTTEFDGLHYGKEGNRQSGLELSRLIARDFYALKDTVNIDSPNIKKIFYKTPEKKQVILVFDEGQELVYPDPYKPNGQVTLDMKDFFYFNGESGSVASARAEGNRIILELKAPQQALTMDLMPMYTPEDGPYYPLNGPFIKNKLGMRAFTFFKVPIGESLNVPELAAELESNGNVQLTWKAVPGVSKYVLERKLEGETEYKSIAQPGSATLSYTDKNVAQSGKASFRLKGVSKLSESADYGYAEIETAIITGVEKDQDVMFTVFPNPVQKGQLVTVQMKKPVNGTLSLLNANGQSLSGEPVPQGAVAYIRVPENSAGYYFIKLKAGDQIWLKKVLVR